MISARVYKGRAVIKAHREINENISVKCLYENCNHYSSTLDDLKKHNILCGNARSSEFGNYCKICSYSTKSRTEIEKHIQDSHTTFILKTLGTNDDSDPEASVGEESSESEHEEEDVVSESDDGLLEDCDEGVGPRMKIKYDKSITQNEVSNALLKVCNTWRENQSPGFYKRSEIWTKAFRKSNYSINPLFMNLLKPENLTYCVLTTFKQYLPLSKKSLKFSSKITNKYDSRIGQKGKDDWQQLNLFEGINNNSTSVIYCGGPIQSIEWIPLPDLYPDGDYIAISCRNKFGENYTFGDQILHKCIIQIWKMKNINDISPEYQYSFTFDYGPIYAMKFCPSGGYVPNQRLGILAIASMNGNIYLYSLPTNVPNTVSSENRIITINPSQSLVLNFNTSSDNECKNKAIRLVWSREAGHSIIVAGYGNGMIAIWNLLSESPLIRRDTFVLPIHIFYPFSHPITALDIHPASTSRYLLVAAEKNLRLYDIKTFTNPVQMADHKILTDTSCGIFPLHWSGYAIGRMEGASVGKFNSFK